ncbi:hypothetical protein [Aggregatilinea lenta]|uniref:hypothetical protein n=1 Tax=Aggregatilinea lenta TaxID=913108 RepID=UPI0013C2ECBE|nr:hypothetical protein [Aggregatilinea lenta]
MNTNSPGKVRNQYMRTAAELLRHLSQKTSLDDEVKDMAAELVFCLRGIDDGIETSAEAWEKRDYWIKAEQLRQRWGWVGSTSARLESMIRSDAWETMPGILASMVEHFADITITKFTRKPSEWLGAYDQLIDDLNQEGK